MNSLYQQQFKAQDPLFTNTQVPKQDETRVPEVPNINNQLPESFRGLPQTIRVVHINNRIRVRIFADETFDDLLQKVR